MKCCPARASSACTRATSTPCNRLDQVFRDGRYPDPYYDGAPRRHAHRRRVLHAAAQNCFCHLVGRRRGAVRLRPVPAGHRRHSYLVSISSVGGRQHLGGRRASPREADRRGPHRRSAHATARAPGARSTPTSPTSRTSPCSWTPSTRTTFWEELGGRCLGLHRLRRGVPDVLLLRHRRTVLDRPTGTAGRAPPRVGRLHESPQFAHGGRRPQLPARRTARAQCTASACTTSSTVFWPRTTACCAWGAAAA